MHESETDKGDLVLIQTLLLHYVNQVILMLKSIFQEQFPKQSKEGLYQNKVTLSLASIHNYKMAYRWFSLYVIAAMLVDGKQKIAH